jgi:hypothetical protein
MISALGRSDYCHDFIEEETGVNISDNLGKCGAENLESHYVESPSEKEVFPLLCQHFQ